MVDLQLFHWTWRRKLQPVSSPWSNTDLDFQENTSQYFACNNLNTLFTDPKPRSVWLVSFMRHHNLTVKKPQSIEIARRNCIYPFIIYNYF
ncbi:hypothetical protein PR048_024849 [Dryococelus australis]|uniref:Uncharacterized protein n=1 Tax=Dryococelus australis TaxID=614101 RepID=A0ABQ9GPQ8_9NEOP|nr:hypothetical protein PR048_024849 [Dryococelus australis]